MAKAKPHLISDLQQVDPNLCLYGHLNCRWGAHVNIRIMLGLALQHVEAGRGRVWHFNYQLQLSGGSSVMEHTVPPRAR